MCKDMKKKRIEEMFFSYFFLCPLYFMEYVSWADVVGEFTKKSGHKPMVHDLFIFR